MKGKQLAIRAIPALVAAAFAGHAGASGFQLWEQNASGLGNAYAGSAAVADNASTIYFNPAGMTQLQAREFSLGMNAVKPSFKFSNDRSSTGVLRGNGGDGGDWAFIPNAYLSWALNKDLYVGLGIGAPFGLVTEYENPWVGAAHSRKFEIKTLNINPSIAYRVNDTVSLGLGLNWQKLDAEYIRTVGVGTVRRIPLSASTAKLTLDDDAWGWNIGALFNVSPTTKVGVSYRSSIEYTATGNLKVTGPVTAFNQAQSSRAKADIEFPDSVIVSATQDLNDRWQLLGDLSWTGWSTIPKVEIYRTSGAADGTVAQTLETKFRDTWRVALGANYKLDDAWKLKFGIAYDQSPVRSAEDRLTSLPDSNRFWFSTGAQWKPNKASTVDLGLAYLYIKDTKIDNDQTALARGLVNGTYDSSIWILGAQYSMAF
jgi:long-chain fatty acid transport protein